MFDYRPLKTIAITEFSDIIAGADILQGRVLRLFVRNGSYTDIFYSTRSPTRRYAYHWEHRMIDGTLYRHDNVPDGAWASVKTFPKHYHDGSEDQVRESDLSDTPEEAIRAFLFFVREKLTL